jgi:integrase/recombinase XerD
MRFGDAIDEFIEDMRLQGRINSDSTERSYRGTLYKHADDVSNRDPRKVGREDVKRTLARWGHPNTRATCRAALVSFYRWMVEEGMRSTNPAEQTRRPRRRPATKYRLSRQEVHKLLAAARGSRERRAIYLGVYAGLRRGELRGLQGRHFQRERSIWVSEDIGKNRKERWVPVPEPLYPITEEIRASLELDDYVFPAQRWRDPGVCREKVDKRKQPCAPQAIWKLVLRVAERAGIAGRVTPHTLRHAYADHMARHTDVRNVQQLLGHAELATTQIYLGNSTLDELQRAVAGFDFGAPAAPAWLSPQMVLANPVEAPTGIEPV